MKARLNILVDHDMKAWVKGYADQHDTNVTTLIVRTFERLRDGELDVVGLDQTIVGWARDYAKRHKTTFNELVMGYLVALKQEEDGAGIKQI